MQKIEFIKMHGLGNDFVIIYKIGERYYARIRICNDDGHND